MKYCWEISLRNSGLVVMRTNNTFETYELAKDNLIYHIKNDFENKVRSKDVAYNYIIYDCEV